MIIISHRGNLNGPNTELENTPSYIDNAINYDFDVEIDIWFIDGNIYLGHDKPQYIIDFRWLRDRINKLWIHCKNLESLTFLKRSGYDFNYFWHQSDKSTMTSKGFLWTYPEIYLADGIVVCFDLFTEDIEVLGICTDNPVGNKKLLNKYE